MMARILVADDEPSAREFVVRGLQSGGHDVEGVEDGLRALETLSERQFDLLLTDIVMPGLDGIELALKAARDHPDMRILMMTGYPGQRQRAYNLEALIHRVLSKPFSLAELLEAVTETLATSRG
jgi:two-component system, cell cycle response regulator CpdR